MLCHISRIYFLALKARPRLLLHTSQRAGLRSKPFLEPIYSFHAAHGAVFAKEPVAFAIRGPAIALPVLLRVPLPHVLAMRLTIPFQALDYGNLTHVTPFHANSNKIHSDIYLCAARRP